MKRISYFTSFFLLISSLLATTFAQLTPGLAQPPSANTTDLITPTDNLVIQGIPTIPSEIPAAVKKYTESIPVSHITWHPTKREMLVTKRAGNTPQLHFVNAPLSTPKQLTSFPDPVTDGSYPPKTPDYFIFSKADRGNEISQLYRYDVDSEKITRLTTDDKKRIGGGPWSNAGNHYIYTALMTGAAAASETFKTELHSINPAAPNTDRLIANLDGVGWSVSDWSPDDKKLAIEQYISINESHLWLLDVESAQKTLLTTEKSDEKVAYSDPQFSKDGAGLYLTTDKDSEFKRLAYLDLATRKTTSLTPHIDWNVSAFRLSEDGKLLAFTTNEDGFSKLHVMDTATRKEIELPGLPPGQIRSAEFHKKSNELAFTVISYSTLADVYSLDLKTMKLTHWAKTELHGYETAGLREPELIRWKSFDGRTIPGFINRPPTSFTGKRPVIINIHGGPEGQSTPGLPGPNAYLTNELGVAIIYPNVRGSTGYGKTFLQLDNGYKREDSVKDIGSLLDWIAAQDNLDKDRIMVTGGSYGGYMTLAVATHYNDRLRCSLDVVGISNFVTFLQNTETYRRDLRRAEYGDERDPKMREFLTKISPLTNAGQIRKPLFVVQGKNDPRVPFSESEQIVAAARKNNTPVWYLMANDEGHGFRKKNNQDYLFYATVLFVKNHLLN